MKKARAKDLERRKEWTAHLAMSRSWKIGGSCGGVWTVPIPRIQFAE